MHGWCPGQNMVYERTKRACREYGDAVSFRTIDTTERKVLGEWGIVDGVFIDGKRIGGGPPLSYAKIKNIIGKKVTKG